MKLSICITTLNRAAFIEETLDSIVPQLTESCELVVLDAASTDDTEGMVLRYAQRCARVRYIRQETNNGIDRDLDRVIELARGDYCWLMTDDDLLKPHAVATVLAALCRSPSVVIVNVELKDFGMSKVVQSRWLQLESDRLYGPEEMDRLFVEMDGWLNCNSFIIRREIWLARERERYYGSLLIHLAVIFQEPLPGEAIVIAWPVISYRRGNTHTFSAQVREIIWSKWPSVVESLTLSQSVKRKVRNAEPWKHPSELLLWRGRGFYSLIEYRRWVSPRVRSRREALIPALIAFVPGGLINAILVLYYSLTHRSYGFMQPELLLQELRESRFHFRNWRIVRRDPRDYYASSQVSKAS